MNNQDLDFIINGFFEHKIVEISLEKPFVLASGRVSPIYIDHRRIFSVPALRTRVVQVWAETIRENLCGAGSTSLVIAGTATAGIAPAYALAEAMQCGFVYVRAKAKGHGTERVVEGVWAPGCHVLVVDDMVTTGASILSAIEKIREAEGVVGWASCITRHDFPSTLTQFHNREIQLSSVFTTAVIFEVAYRLRLINSIELAAVTQWLSVVTG